MKILKKEDLQLVIACLSNKSYDQADLKTVLDRFGDDYFVGDSRKLEKVKDNKEMSETRSLAHWRHKLTDRPSCVSIACTLVCPACGKETHRPTGVNYKYCPHCGARIRRGDYPSDD